MNNTAYNQLIAHMRLARTDGVGSTLYRKLLQKFGSAEEACEGVSSLLKGKEQRRFHLPSRTTIEKEFSLTHKLGGKIFYLNGPGYPPMLAALPDPPPLLCFMGANDVLQSKLQSISIVGARNASANGMRLAESLSTELAAHGYIIVSGMARGIDQAAHRGAMCTGITLAVVAGGLDKPYPPEHTSLQRSILEQGGGIITEAPLGTSPQGRHFPRRNRLIAGLCHGCLVIEAARHSGSLITAQMALDYGKMLFAIPGSPIDPRSRGSNNLLREGAILVETASDIMAELPDTPVTPPSQLSLPQQKVSAIPHLHRNNQNTKLPFADATSPMQLGRCATSGKTDGLKQIVLDLLSTTPVPIDDLVRLCQDSTSNVMIAVTELELSGLVISAQEGYMRQKS